MKKLLLSLGAVAAVAAPVAAVVACSNDDSTTGATVSYDKATGAAKIDFGSKTADLTSLTLAATDLAKKIVADKGTKYTVTVSSTKAKADIVTVEHTVVADTTYETLSGVILMAVTAKAGTTTTDGWASCFDNAVTK